MMPKVVFVLGLQGIGKSVWIADNFPDAAVVDFEYYWSNPVPSMESYEIATWSKLMAQQHLIYLMDMEYETIAVECTGVTRVSQAGIRAMMGSAVVKGYSVEVVYLKPKDEDEFERILQDNPGGIKMLRDCQIQRRYPNSSWRQPTACPYLKEHVTKVVIDHSSWNSGQPGVYHVEVR